MATQNATTDNALAVIAALVGSRDPLISSQSYPWAWSSYARAAETQAESAPTYAEREALERAAALLWEQEAEDRAEREALEEAEAAKTNEEREAERAEEAARLARHLNPKPLLPAQTRA